LDQTLLDSAYRSGCVSVELQDTVRTCSTPTTRNFFGFCLRVIVNETHLNLLKTTSSVLSVILINLCEDVFQFLNEKLLNLTLISV